MITPEQAKEELRDRARAELARRSLGDFTDYTFPGFDNGATLCGENISDTINNALEKVATGEIKRLMVFLPPRIGKTERVNKRFSSYLLGKRCTERMEYEGDPDKKPRELRIVVCSYSGELSDRFGRETRDIIMDYRYNKVYPKAKLRKDRASVSDWELEDGSSYYAVGVGGSLTGMGFDIGIIDDPFKNREESESEAYRKKIKERYMSVFYTRQMDSNAAIILMCTRWHEDDLAGWLLSEQANDGEERTVVSIPAEKDGECIMWEHRGWDRDYWDKTKGVLTPYERGSLYLQEPFLQTEGDFTKEMFEYYEPHEIEQIPFQKMMFVDPAISQRDTADYSAISVVGIDKRSNYTYILDLWRGRVPPNELTDKIFEMYLIHKPDRVGIENVAFQKALILEVRKVMRDKNIFFVLDEIRPMGEKTARIRANLAGRYANNNVIHPRRHRFLKDYESELLKFPAGRHDDMIDSVSGAVSMTGMFNKGRTTGNFRVDFSRLF